MNIKTDQKSSIFLLIIYISNYVIRLYSKSLPFKKFKVYKSCKFVQVVPEIHCWIKNFQNLLVFIAIFAFLDMVSFSLIYAKDGTPLKLKELRRPLASFTSILINGILFWRLSCSASVSSFWHSFQVFEQKSKMATLRFSSRMICISSFELAKNLSFFYWF